jgi:hypothetical protein
MTRRLAAIVATDIVGYAAQWRRMSLVAAAQDDKPSRSEAIRRLLNQALKVKGKR